MQEYQLKLEARWKSGAKEPHKLTAKTILENIQVRSLHERSDFTLQKAKNIMNILKKQFKDKGTTTDMADLRMKIDFVHVPTAQPLTETAVQTEPYKEEK